MKQGLSRIAAAVAFGLLATACGGSPSDLSSLAQLDPSTVDGGSAGTPDSTATPEAPAPAAPAAPSAPAAVTGATPAAFSWTKPPNFDNDLQAAISAQPSFMNGYGGQIDNPFPRLEGTAWFSGAQITRPDAIVLGNHFGRPSFRFYVDASSRHSNGLRAEFTGTADYQFKEGDTYEYRFSTYFGSDYRNSAWTDWNMFAQFHGPGFPAWGLHTAGGYLLMGPPTSAQNQFRIPMPARGQWHDFVWTIHWSHGSAGWATLQVDGVNVFDHRGPTMHDTEAYYYPKFGSYLANNPYTQVTYSTPWVIVKR